jgi:hypothetical protein
VGLDALVSSIVLGLEPERPQRQVHGVYRVPTQILREEAPPAEDLPLASWVAGENSGDGNPVLV